MAVMMLILLWLLYFTPGDNFGDWLPKREIIAPPFAEDSLGGIDQKSGRIVVVFHQIHQGFVWKCWVNIPNEIAI